MWLMHLAVRVRSHASLVYAVGLTALLVYTAWAFGDLTLGFWRDLATAGIATLFRLGMGALILLGLIVAAEAGMARLSWKTLNWRLFGVSINFLPMRFRWLRWSFLALLLFQIPVLAFTEEAIFRDGWVTHPTKSWIDGTFRSIAFGFAHLLSGVPVRVCVALIGGGLWFTAVYLQSDVFGSTMAHTLYNCLAFTYILGRWARTGIDPFRQ